MAERFKRQLPSTLEIRGFSRESLTNHPKPNILDNLVMRDKTRSPLFYSSMFLHNDIESDYEDDSTLTGGSQNTDSPNCNFVEDDTLTGCGGSNFWSAANSYTTGNTTERSSLFSWGDNDFDHQTSLAVNQMFLDIDHMLFEGVLSGSSSLQQECREWMKSFPHLRILGKQILKSKEEGFQFIPVNNDLVRTNSTSSSNSCSTDIISVKGKSISPQILPGFISNSLRLKTNESSSSTRSVPLPGDDLSHLNEEVLEQDGQLEELIAYNTTEIEDEDKRYHVPRRRRLGFPPVTPNACVRDAVLHQLFDEVWLRLVTELASKTEKGECLLKLLVQKITNRSSNKPPINQAVNDQNDSEQRINGLVSSQYTQHTFGGKSNRSLRLQSNSTDDFPQINSNYNSLILPLTRPYYDQTDLGFFPRQVSSHLLSRVPTAPNQIGSNQNSLNGLMTISQKKLQLRSDKTSHGDDLSQSIHENKLPARPASSNLAITNRILFHPDSYQMLPSQQSRDIISSSSLLNNRQMSGNRKLNRGSRAAGRLQPLDNKRTKGLKPQFNGFVRATKLIKPPALESSHLQQAPWSSGSNFGGAGPLWINSRLPPINNLESLNENSALDLKKSRGKTAFSRISSAFIEDKTDHNKIIDKLSRPNTTHTFRAEGNFANKRSTTSVALPPHLNLNAYGSSLSINGIRSNSPSSFNSPGNPTINSFAYNNNPINPSNSQTSLSGITGMGILGTNVILSQVDDNTQQNWGHPTGNIEGSSQRRKQRISLGLI